MHQRTAGVLLHITSLSNPFPIGDLGPAAYAFVDFLRQSGHRWWQMLPIGPIGKGHSPYNATSAFGGNALLISPEKLVEQGLLAKKDIQLPALRDKEKVNYPIAIQFKRRLLKKAFKNFEQTKHANLHVKFNLFIHSECAWLNDFSLFYAIQENVKTSDWTQWRGELKSRHPKALVSAEKQFKHEIRFHQFVQWQFALQWSLLRHYCHYNGIRLIGDIPLFVAHQSPDVWANQEIFKLAADGHPTVTAGVPPDYFSRTGQMWHVPVYCWDVLKKQHYKWWIQRLQTHLQRFDLLRLDHFIGFSRTYEISAQAKTAIHGEYHQSGGLSFFKSVYKTLGKLPFIADDLGLLTNEVVTLRQQLKIPGTQVLQFDLQENLATNFIKPKKYPVNSVMYTATHDNDTTKGWYLNLPVKQRKMLCKQFHTTPQEMTWSMIRTALAAKSRLAITPMQDILGLGSEARMNIPGKTNGNWQWRLKKNALTNVLNKKMKKLLQTVERTKLDKRSQ